MPCRHESTHEVPGSTCCFSGPVNVEPYTSENRAAHGNIQYVQECDRCGSRRAVNVNQSFAEYAPWGPDAEERRREERREAERIRQEQEAREDAILAEQEIAVVGRHEREGYHAIIHLTVRGERMHVEEWKIKQAANQEDTGDGLVPKYRAILRHARRMEFAAT